MAKPRTQLFGLLAISVVLLGCAGTSKAPISKGQIQDSAPALTAAELTRLANLPDPPVESLAYSASGNGPTYEVWGKQYRVMSTARGYQQTGGASWYGVKFHGRLTSSREPFDMYQLTAAHRSLPIPCFARVTNLENGKSTVVRINDRGPFHSERIIDLSFAAAVKLGFHDQGTAQVSVEVLEPKSAAGRTHLIAVGAFIDQAQAQGVVEKLLTPLGLAARVTRNAQMRYQLELGPIAAGAELERLTALLTTMDLGDITILSAQ